MWLNKKNQMNYFSNCKTPDEAKRVYYKQSFKLHPDRPGGSTQAFQELTRQYEEYKNPRTAQSTEQNNPEQKKTKLVSFIELLNDPQFNDIFKIIETSFGYSKKQIIDIISNPGLLNMIGKELLINFIQKKL
jgi:curved DNA-binding protein CbpA